MHTYILGLVAIMPNSWAVYICYFITSTGKICPWNEEVVVEVRGRKVQNPT